MANGKASVTQDQCFKREEAIRKEISDVRKRLPRRRKNYPY